MPKILPSSVVSASAKLERSASGPPFAKILVAPPLPPRDPPPRPLPGLGAVPGPSPQEMAAAARRRLASEHALLMAWRAVPSYDCELARLAVGLAESFCRAADRLVTKTPWRLVPGAEQRRAAFEERLDNILVEAVLRAQSGLEALQRRVLSQHPDWDTAAVGKLMASEFRARFNFDRRVIKAKRRLGPPTLYGPALSAEVSYVAGLRWAPAVHVDLG